MQCTIGNESVPKIIINDTVSLFFKTAISFLYTVFEKYIYIIALEMASPGNQHCDSRIGTLSFPVILLFVS